MSCKGLAALLGLAVLCGCLCGCQSTPPESSVPLGQAPETPPTVSALPADRQFTEAEKNATYDASTAVKVTLADGASTSTAAGSVSVNGNVVTISREGTYVLTGSLPTGQLVVDAGEKAEIRLVLAGVSIHCADSAALHIKKVGQVVITLADGSQNTLSADGLTSNVDGALYAKGNLSVNGGGRLTVTSTVHGIVCKGSLGITGGSFAVTAQEHAIQSKDNARIAGGSFTLDAGRDGIHVENTQDTSVGYLYIAGGSFAVTAGEDGLSASNQLQITGGTGNIRSGGGAVNGTSSAGQHGYGGWRDQYQTTTDEVSAKGCKAESSLLFAGGTWTLDTADDGLHSNGDLTVSGGTVTIASGDDGIHADGVTVLQNGTVTITESYEGIEGSAIEIAGGVIAVKADDDGLNAAGGNDQSGYGSHQQDAFNPDGGSAYIRISGGKLTVDAAGDGIDANMTLYVSGGETYVSGPTNSGNGALDYGSSAQITGGIFVATGASGMAQGFSAAEGQGAILVNTSGSGGEIVLTDSQGKVLFSWTPNKSFNSVVLSCPGLVKGSTYTLTVGDSSQTITLSDWIYGSAGGMGGPGGPGGPGGGMPPGGGRPGGRM